MFTFSLPWVFIFLLLPVVVYGIFPKAQRQNTALIVPFFSRVENASGQSSHTTQSHSWRKLGFLSLIWLLLVTAAAKPQWVGEPVSLPASGRDLLLAVDISGSMELDDMVIQGRRIPRLLVVKHVVGEFLENRKHDRVGLILFASQAYLQSPLTFDRKTVKRFLDEAMIRFAGTETAIGDAIGLAIKRLKDRPDSQRVLILLTDGANSAGEVEPEKAAEMAAELGIKIYTVGVGSEYFARRRGSLDENSLSKIASLTGGQYFRARNPQELQEIYTTLDKLEPIEQESTVFRPKKSLFYWPLAAALVIWFGYWMVQTLPITFFRRREAGNDV